MLVTRENERHVWGLKKKTDKLNELPKTAVTKLIFSVFYSVSVLFIKKKKKTDFAQFSPSFSHKQSDQIEIN